MSCTICEIAELELITRVAGGIDMQQCEVENDAKYIRLNARNNREIHLH